jgi:transforming growth factor-beta-induced protein
MLIDFKPKSNKMKKLKFFALLLAASTMSLTFNACSDDDDDDDIQPTTNNNQGGGNQQQNIAEIAIAGSETDSLVVALQSANLVSLFQGSTEYTVFAPTNAAFATFISNTNGVDRVSDIPNLDDVLKYHVLQGEVKSGSLTDNMYANSLNDASPDNDLTVMKINTMNGVMINNSVSVSTPDVDASNGVIHLIDGIITPLNVVDLAVNDRRFDSLEVALGVASLVNTVRSANGITLFAPTNSAFRDLLATNSSWNRISDIPLNTLSSALAYHVYAGGNVQSGELGPLDGQSIAMFNNSGNLIISGTSLITSQSDTVDINLDAVNIQGTNGVIHAIRGVLLP